VYRKIDLFFVSTLVLPPASKIDSYKYNKLE